MQAFRAKNTNCIKTQENIFATVKSIPHFFIIKMLTIFIVLLVCGAALGGPSIGDVVPKFNNRGQVVFLGDSITDWWKYDGRPTWDEFYEPLGAVNTGVAGDRTTTIIDRINNEGLIDNMNAYLAVLKIGINDVGGGATEATVVQNIGIILDLIKARNPGVKIILLGILPIGVTFLHQRCRNVNFALNYYADNATVFFIDMDEQFADGLGIVKQELYLDDQIHITAAGYVMWAQTMNPIFNTVLNSPFRAKAVWLGDSLTDWWQQAGAPIWNEFYLPLNSLNVGRASDKSEDTINRILSSGVLDGLNSKVAVLLIGGNDLTAGSQAPYILNNIHTIIGLIRERLPHGRILVLGILPAGGMPPSLIEQSLIINAGLEEMAIAEDDLFFLDMRQQFADENFNIYPELYLEDQTHLSLAGYEVWHRTMDPIFTELLKF